MCDQQSLIECSLNYLHWPIHHPEVSGCPVGETHGAQVPSLGHSEVYVRCAQRTVICPWMHSGAAVVHLSQLANHELARCACIESGQQSMPSAAVIKAADTPLPLVRLHCASTNWRVTEHSCPLCVCYEI